MKMSEMPVNVVITKYDSPCLPYLDVIRMLQSVKECDNKNKVNYKQNKLTGCLLPKRCC